MERFVGIANLWSWLPAFRAVAETEHVGNAARILGVTPSALSRSIRLLEQELKEELFTRVGRNVQLTPVGREFLEVVRDAMRRLDDGVSDVRSERIAGPLSLSSRTEIAVGVVLPAMREVVKKYPTIEPQLHHFEAIELESRLLRGMLDIGLVQDPRAYKRVEVTALGTYSRGIYARRGHPLAARERLTVAEVLAVPFVGSTESEAVEDHEVNWPSSSRTKLFMFVPDTLLVLEVLLASDVLAVLPDYLPRAVGKEDLVVRLPFEGVPPSAIYALRRVPLVPFDRVEVALHALWRAARLVAALPALGLTDQDESPHAAGPSGLSSRLPDRCAGHEGRQEGLMLAPLDRGWEKRGQATFSLGVLRNGEKK